MIKRFLLNTSLFFVWSCIVSCQTIKQERYFQCSKYLDKPYGVTMHIGKKYVDYPYMDSLLYLAENSGMNYVRCSFDPDCKDIWWDVAANIEKHSLKTSIGIPLVYNGRRPWDNFTEYESYLHDVIGRYSNIIDVCQLLNEPDNIPDGDNVKLHQSKIAATKYIGLLPKLSQSVRKKAPRAEVVMCSLCMLDSYFIEELFRSGSYMYTDVCDFHSYRRPEDLNGVFVRISDLMNQYDVHPHFWMSECGMSTELNGENSNYSSKYEIEVEQAKRVARIHLISFASGVDKVFWYCMRSRENDLYNKEDHFGLLHKDLSPKPAYLAYNTMTEMCPDQSLRPTLLVEGDKYLCAWERPDGKKIWAVWCKSVEPIESICIKNAESFVDYMGNKVDEPNNLTDGVLYVIGNKHTNVSFK